MPQNNGSVDEQKDQPLNNDSVDEQKDQPPNNDSADEQKDQALNSKNENPQGPEVEVKASIPDTFIDTSYSIFLAAGIKALGSDALKNFQQNAISGFTASVGANIIATSSKVASAQKAHSEALEAIKISPPALIIPRAKDIEESAKDLTKEIIDDTEQKQSAFWITAAISYIAGGFSRNVIAMGLDKSMKSSNSWFFSKSQTDEEKKNTHWWWKNIGATTIGAAVGMLAGLAQSITHGSGNNPRFTGLWLGALSAALGCVTAELRDMSIKSKIEIKKTPK
jgi:hypothetical protein